MIRVICDKCKETSNENSVYCTSCYYKLVNKVTKLEEEKEALLLEIQKLKGNGGDWEW